MQQQAASRRGFNAFSEAVIPRNGIAIFVLGYEGNILAWNIASTIRARALTQLMQQPGLRPLDWL